MRKNIFLVSISALLLILSFPNFNLGFLSWFGFVPLFFAIQGKSKFKAFLLSYLTGIIFWLGIIYWLVHVTFFGMLLLVLYLALYFGVFGLIFNYALRTMHYELLVIPSVWVILEYLRNYIFSGFPWALLGYSQYLNLWVIQIADIFGVWGVSFLVMLVNVLVYSVVRLPSSVFCERKKYLTIIFLLVITLVYGYYNIYGIRNTEYGIQPKISVIQGNIPQELKWEVYSRDFIFNKYLHLTSLAVKEESPDLIIWPEAAMPVVFGENQEYFERLKSFTQATNKPLLLGTVRIEDGLYYNSALLVSSRGEYLKYYDKIHLVPFGEFIPFKKIFGFLETIVPIGDFTAGRDYTVFELPYKKSLAVAKFSVLICFEDLFPELVRRFVKKGADFLVNITNDAWFKKTPAASQHLQASVFRAVENRRYLLRAANTGISGFISPAGEIISLVKDKDGKNIFVDGYLTGEINLNKEKITFYTLFGDFFILICLIFILMGRIKSSKTEHV